MNIRTYEHLWRSEERCAASPVASSARRSLWTARREESAPSWRGSHPRVPRAGPNRVKSDQININSVLAQIASNHWEHSIDTDTHKPIRTRTQAPRPYSPRRTCGRSSSTPSPAGPGSPSACGSGCPASAWPGRWAGPCGPSRRCSAPPPTSSQTPAYPRSAPLPPRAAGGGGGGREGWMCARQPISWVIIRDNLNPGLLA